MRVLDDNQPSKGQAQREQLKMGVSHGHVVALQFAAHLRFNPRAYHAVEKKRRDEHCYDDHADPDRESKPETLSQNMFATRRRGSLRKSCGNLRERHWMFLNRWT